MFCSNCGKEIADGSRFCPECGTQFNAPTSSTNKSQVTNEGTRDQVQSTDLVYPKNPPTSPHIAWLSIIWPGIPVLIHGQVLKGIVLMVVSMISLVLPIITLVIIIASTIDAYKVGNVLAAGNPVTKWEWFPNPN